MTITPNVFGIGPPRPTQDWDLIEWTDYDFVAGGPQTINLERWSITEVEFSPGNFSPHRDVLLQSDSLDRQMDLNFQNFDDRLTQWWFRREVLGVVQGTRDIWINMQYDDEAFPGPGTPEPFLQVWKAGGALHGPLVMSNARVIVGPTKIGPAFYFGVVDHTSGLGQLFKTNLDLSTGAGPNTATQIGADTGAAFPNAPTTTLPQTTPSGCNNFIATDEYAAMLINNGGSTSGTGPDEAWVFPLDGATSPTLATVSGMADFNEIVNTGTLRSPAGIWLPGRNLGIFKDRPTAKTYTISPTAVVFTDLGLSASIGNGGWTMLDDEIRLLAEANLAGEKAWEQSSFNLVDIDTNTETLDTGEHFTDVTRTTPVPVAGNQSLWVPHADL